MPPVSVDGPLITLVRLGTTEMWFPDAPAQAGDQVAFIASLDEAADAQASCEDAWLSTTIFGVIGRNKGAELTFTRPGRYILCYRFNFLELSYNQRPKALPSFGLYADSLTQVTRAKQSACCGHLSTWDWEWDSRSTVYLVQI